MKFKMTHFIFETEEFFTESNAPDWLTSSKSVPGSTMDDRWFWNEQVLTLEVGESIETDFHVIKRVE